jgi:hypothetical protein
VAKQGNTGEKWPLNVADEHLSCSWGSFTCRKFTTWDRRLYFPSEGRRATDFIALKIHRPRPSLNPRTLGPVASTLTTTPPRAMKKLTLPTKIVESSTVCVSRATYIKRIMDIQQSPLISFNVSFSLSLSLSWIKLNVLFQFRITSEIMNHRHTVGLLGRVTSSSQGLHLHRTT